MAGQKTFTPSAIYVTGAGLIGKNAAGQAELLSAGDVLTLIGALPLSGGTITGPLTVSGGDSTVHGTEYFKLQAPGGVNLVRGISAYGRADLEIGQVSGYVSVLGGFSVNGIMDASSYAVQSISFAFLNVPFEGINIVGREGSTVASGDIHIRPGTVSSAVVVNSDVGLVVQNRNNTGYAPITAGAGTFSDAVALAPKTIATLPSAASSQYKRYIVTDSTPAGRIVFSNGSAWYYEDGVAV